MGFGIKQRLVNALDRPGGRTLLATSVTLVARLRGFNDLRVFFENQRWFHQVGRTSFPGRSHFDQWPRRFEDFASQERQYFSDAKDYWMWHLTPAPGATVVDVGAGEGEDVLAFSRAVGEHGRVLAIEAFPSTFDVLREFCARNRLTNVLPIQVALADKQGTICFNDSMYWVENAVNTDSSGGIEVRCATLRSVCTEYEIDAIDYLKMNIEGAEVQALNGMVDLMPRIKAICVSCHDFRAERGDGEQFRTREFVINFLTSHGFDLKFRDDPRPYVRDQVLGVRRLTD